MSDARGSTPGRAFRIALAVSAILLVGARAAAHAQAMNPDGVAYLEIAEAYVGGRWSEVVNGYWSPLYSWLLAIPLALVRPSPAWEYPLAHLVNLAVFAGAAIALDYYLRSLLRVAPAGWADAGNRIVVHGLWAIGYVMLAWIGFEVIDIATVTPDWCVAALYLVATGMFLRWIEVPPSRRQRVLAGALLAAAYLSKAAMLPVSLVILACVLVFEWRARRRGRDLLIAGLVFGIVAAPWIAALSLHKGRLTPGDTAKLNYVWYVSGPGDSRPMHPTRALGTAVPSFDFPGPVAGAYPPWRDPSYWNDGLRPQLDLGAQLGIIRYSARVYVDFVLGNLVGIVIALLLLAVAVIRRRPGESHRIPYVPAALVLVPSVAAAAMYALVHVQWRFLGGFMVASTLVLLVALIAMAGRTRLTMPALALCLASLLVETAAQARADLPLLGAGWSASRWPLHTARQLQEGGVAPGTDIAVIGSGASFAAWARVARLCIVAEVPTRHVATYQGADPAARQAVLDALARAGSRAVVAEFPDGRAPDEGWRLVTDTPLHYRPLAPEATLTDQSGAGGRRTDSHAAWCPARGASRHAATAARVKVIR